MLYESIENKCKDNGSNTIQETSTSQCVPLGVWGSDSQTGNVPQDIPADLQAVMDAWPLLPDALKAGILAMVQASTPKP